MNENFEKTPLKLFKKKHLIDKKSLTPLKVKICEFAGRMFDF